MGSAGIIRIFLDLTSRMEAPAGIDSSQKSDGNNYISADTLARLPPLSYRVVKGQIKPNISSTPAPIMATGTRSNIPLPLTRQPTVGRRAFAPTKPMRMTRRKTRKNRKNRK